MNLFKKLLGSTLYLFLAFIVLLLGFMYANSYLYKLGKEIGAKLVDIF